MEAMSLIMFGAGGHASVVIDAVRASGAEDPRGIVDDNPRLHGNLVMGIPVIGRESVPSAPTCFHVAIGGNAQRERIAAEMVACGHTLITVIHPRAELAFGAQFGDGCFIAALGLVAPGAKLGRGCIVNHGAVVDHDCVVGDWVHIAPNATLCGGIVVGRGATIGAGAVVQPGVVIGEGAIVGSGAVVTRNVPDGMVVVGSPACELRR
jgi:sugar O-acyltransferase (sialic acid O-acetyltransferase NeuD family)